MRNSRLDGVIDLVYQITVDDLPDISMPSTAQWKQAGTDPTCKLSHPRQLGNIEDILKLLWWFLPQMVDEVVPMRAGTDLPEEAALNRLVRLEREFDS